jgi:hypothetical protein
LYSPFSYPLLRALLPIVLPSHVKAKTLIALGSTSLPKGGDSHSKQVPDPRGESAGSTHSRRSPNFHNLHSVLGMNMAVAASCHNWEAVRPLLIKRHCAPLSWHRGHFQCQGLLSRLVEGTFLKTWRPTSFHTVDYFGQVEISKDIAAMGDWSCSHHRMTWNEQEVEDRMTRACLLAN